MLFTEGETPLALPTGMSAVQTQKGVVHFNPELTTALKVKQAVAAGRENEILGLGSENKADVTAAPGTPAVVTERTPEGVEVKAAAASEAKLPETQATLEESKTPGNTVQVEEPGQVLADRRNRTAIEGLHQTIGSLDEQIAQAQRAGFEEPTARRKPLPGPEAAAARDALQQLDAQREDASNQLIHFTPESAPTPPTRTEEAHNARGRDLGSLLDDAKAKLTAQNAIVDSLRPENARRGVDENGNTVEDIGGMSKEEREAYNEAKADAAGLRNAVRHLEQKLKEHAQSEPEPIGAAPQITERPIVTIPTENERRLREQGFYSKLGKLVDSLPDALVETAGKTVPGREIKAKEIRNPKTGELIKKIEGGKEPDKVYPSVSVAEQLQKLAQDGKVSPDELKWSGIIPWLKTQGKAVSRQELQDFIRTVGTVKVEEKYFGHDPRKAETVSAYQEHRRGLIRQANEQLTGAQEVKAAATRRKATAEQDYNTAKGKKDFAAADEALARRDKANAEEDQAVERVIWAKISRKRVEDGQRPTTIDEIQKWVEAKDKINDDFSKGLLTAHERDQRLFEADARINNTPEQNAAYDRHKAAAENLTKTTEALGNKVTEALAAKDASPPTIHDVSARLYARADDVRYVEGLRELAPAEVEAHLAAIKEEAEANSDAKRIDEEVAASNPQPEPDVVEPTTYGGYMKPFAPGENYRELIVTMPKGGMGSAEAEKAYLDTSGGKFFWYQKGVKVGGPFDSRGEAVSHPPPMGVREIQDPYHAPHFGGVDLVFNTLVDDRVDTTGKKVAFIQEAQSDRHQAGARQGYKEAPDAKELAEAQSKYNAANKRDRELRDQSVAALKELGYLGFDRAGEALDAIRNHPDFAERWDLNKPEDKAHRELFQKWKDAYQEANVAEQALGKLTGVKGVPDAPYRKTYFLESFKRVLRDAVHAGLKTVGWNVGDTLNERYNLSQAVKKLTHVPTQDGKIDLEVHTTSGQFGLRVNPDGTISRGSIRGRDVTGKPLSELLGNSIADEILSTKKTPEQMKAEQAAIDTANEKLTKAHEAYNASEKNAIVASRTPAENKAARQPLYKAIEAADKELKSAQAAHENTIEGEGLNIGGEGKRRLYDQKAVADIGDYVAQWGGKVEKGEMPTGGPINIKVRNPAGEVINTFDSMTGAQRYVDSLTQPGATIDPIRPETRPYHRVDITPEMARAVTEEGQPIAAANDKAIENVAKIKGVPEGPLKAYDQKFQSHFLPEWKAKLEKLWGQAVNITFSDKVETPSVRPLRGGGIEVLIPPDFAARVFAAHGREGGDARLAEVFREEGIHGAVIKALHDEWLKMDPATRPDFYEFNKQVTGKVASEILDTVRGLRAEGKHGEAFAIEQAVRNAKDLYDGAVGDTNSLTGRQILEQLAKDPAGAYKYVHEMLRQFAQIRENGQITETTYQKIVGAITDLYRRALESLKGVADKAYSGEISKTMGDILRRVEEARKAPSKEMRPDIPVRPREQVRGNEHLEEQVIPWHGTGSEDINARTSSRSRPGYSAGQAAADFLSDSHGNGPETLRPDQRNEVDLAKLAQFESSRGRLIDRGAIIDGSLEKAGGGEHEVFYDPKSDRWLKFVRPGSSGLITKVIQTDYPLPEHLSRLGAHAATPVDYLERMRLANEKFGDDQQYHGVWLDRSGEPGGLVISQPHINGQDATSTQVAKRLTEDGFKRVGPETWYRPTDNVIIDDTKPGNFVTDKNGVAQPVDIPMSVASDEVRAEAMRQINSGKRFLKQGELRPAAVGNRTLEEPLPIGAPKFIEKGVKSLAEKTKELRYLWGKGHRAFADSFWRANDVIDTQANNEGNRVTNSVLVDIARAGGGKLHGIADPSEELKANDAATVVLRQAGFGDVTSREEMDAARAKVEDWKARVDAGVQSPDAAVKEAMEHLKPAVDRAHELLNGDPDGLAKALAWAGKVGQETQRQLAGMAAEGFDVEGIDNYIRQVYEQDLSSKEDQYVPSSAGQRGSALDKGILKARYYPDLVTAAEAGKKAVELSASKLVGQGEAALQKLIGQKQLTTELASIPAPVTGKPVLKLRPDKVLNPDTHQMVDVDPKGYVRIDNPTGGKPIWAEQNVAPLFRFLTAASAVRATSPGRLLLQIAAGIKHGTLLFDSYHLIRQAVNLAGLLAQGGNLKEIRDFVKNGLASLDIRPEDLQKYVDEGVITKEAAKFALDNQEVVKRATKSGVNFGKQLDNLYEQIGHPFWVSMLNHIPRGGTKGGGLGDYITDFNKYTFQKAARAAMIIGFKTAEERNQARFPNKTPEEISRLAAREVNEIFGNMGRQGLLKSATAQDMARLFVLAPQWNDGRFRFQGRAIGNLARVAGKLAIGRPEALGNAGGVLLALAGGTFAANQVINLATKGQPTWDNEDGHKLDAYIPGGKNGFYYSPLSLAAEDIHTIAKYGATSSPLDVAKRIALNKASGIGRAGAALAGIGPTGRPLPTDQSKLAQAGKSLLPIPIFASPVVSPYLQPELSQKGDYIRQAAGMAGIKLDRAESPEQRMRAIANKTFPQNFPKVESPGDYSSLRNFVANEKLGDAKNEILRLIAQGKTEDQIRNIFAPDRKLSNSKQQDALLLRKPDARLLLPGVRQDRAVDFRTLQSAMAQARQSPKYQEAVLAGRKAKAPVE